ncbi:alpha/beta hydrolase family protein [Photobacterium sp. R1]
MFQRCLFLFCLWTWSWCAIASEEVVFLHSGHQLSGQYQSPLNGQHAKAVLLFVHGDGAMTYDADGYYAIFWQPLREKGFAIFSWDKPGVGKSTGRWLNQSMSDRQSEVRAAAKAVQDKYGFTSKQTGLVGFSQAGWVLPELAKQPSGFGFMIGIGFASDWIAQGRYYARTRLAITGASSEALKAGLADYDKEIALLRTQPSFLHYQSVVGEGDLSKERYSFVLRNFQSNAEADYPRIAIPTLLLWGDQDLNVDARSEYRWWQVHPNPWVTTQLIKNASHGLLKADTFHSQQFGLLQWIKLMWMEQDAMAPGALPTLLTWLNNDMMYKSQ